MVTLDDRTPPQDMDAEQAVIGCVLEAPRIFRHIDLHADEFYRPAHEEIWLALVELDAAGAPADVISVHDLLVKKGVAARVGGAPYLHTCMAAAPISANATHYARIVREKATLRRTIDALTRSLQKAHDGGDSEEALDFAERELARVPSRDSGEVDSLMSLDEFVDRDLGPVQWVIPGLLAKQERLIVTAGEGVGKSTLIRQFAMCGAAGLSPFSGRSFDPVKTLVIDVENPERIMRDRFDELRSGVRAAGRMPGDRLWLDRRPGGLNLADPRDRRWLHRRVDVIQPDLLVIGPAYKLYVGGNKDKDEDLARMVTAVLDEMRERIGCAIILEHHSAKSTGDSKHRTVEPFGSSLWMRWPEFGFGLRKAEHPAADQLRLVDVKHWRGGRDARKWPARLQSGGTGLPWVESHL